MRTVPPDFPREPHLGSVAGAQPKLTGRMIGDKFIVGLSAEELYDRYDGCQDLAQQLAAYCTRKEHENPDWSQEFNLKRTRQGVERKCNTGEWDFSPAELDWIMTNVRVLLGW